MFPEGQLPLSLKVTFIRCLDQTCVDLGSKLSTLAFHLAYSPLTLGSLTHRLGFYTHLPPFYSAFSLSFLLIFSFFIHVLLPLSYSVFSLIFTLLIFSLTLSLLIDIQLSHSLSLSGIAFSFPIHILASSFNSPSSFNLQIWLSHYH